MLVEGIEAMYVFRVLTFVCLKGECSDKVGLFWGWWNMGSSIIGLECSACMLDLVVVMVIILDLCCATSVV